MTTMQKAAPRTKPCSVCGIEFAYKRSDRICCSLACYAKTPAARATRKRYLERHKDRFNAQSRAYYWSHKDQISERAKFNCQVYRNGDGVSAEQWAEILAAHDGKCSYCGSLQQVGMDHVVPISRGGDHSASNVVPCCHKCNASKRNKLLSEWSGRKNIGLS